VEDIATPLSSKATRAGSVSAGSPPARTAASASARRTAGQRLGVAHGAAARVPLHGGRGDQAAAAKLSIACSNAAS
jgi:hypothetical protein